MPTQLFLTVSRLVLNHKNLKSIRKMCDITKPAFISEVDEEKLLKNARTQHSLKGDDNNILIFKSELSKSSADINLNSGVWIEEISVPQNECNDLAEKSSIIEFPDPVSKISVENDTKRKPLDSSKDPRPPKKKRVKADFMSRDRPGFTEDRYDETTFYFENGLRKVYPYYFTFTTFTKGRWIGEKVLDVFIREFRAHPVKQYEQAVRSGSLKVNDEKVPEGYKLKAGDFLSNTVHRHEIPVVAQPIQIVHLDDDVCIVNKPASIPVHPCGRYRHNTVVFILAKEYNLRNLKPIHRIDRLTSGLLLLGRNMNKAREMQQHINQREVQKEYVCCVEGQFPETITCAEPIEAISHKIGVCRVSKSGSDKGKECQTLFEAIRYDSKSDTSIVKAKPRTGRMHQIRVHLQYLGYPIINDPLYNHEVFGPLKGKGGDYGGKTDDELVEQLIEIHNAENHLGIEVDPLKFKKIERNNTIASISEPTKPNDKSCQTSYQLPDSTFDISKLTTDENCLECKVEYKDPDPEQLVMYLHALKYTGPNWHYETPMPYWAEEGFEHSV